MFEVIWSSWQDRYVVRSVNAISTIRPQFIGSSAECEAWAKAHTR